MGLGPFQPNFGVQNQQVWLQDLYQKLVALQTQTGGALYISGLVLSNNNPDSNDISWSACTVWLNNTAYPIAAGNTTGGAPLVWWNVGDTAFSFGINFPPSPTTYGILTNNQGAADTAWDKVGANSVQASQVVGNLLPPGYQIQAPATATIIGNGTTTLVNFTGGGALLTFGLLISGSPSFTSLSLSINVDGGGAVSYDVADTGAISIGFTLTSTADGTGAAVTNFNISFKTSLVVQVTVTGYVSGNIPVAVGWAKKLA